ncbi:DNA polymerase III subunit epsilon [Nocardia farcinica]|uniref:exonuclease domain-containing protein n=1 Tax=Nocardia farcinica TaxID=37329 RepID=UPI001895F3FA|nr:exonuclease domain-containing protein [Nocardia farcinica]MBF6253129.1 DNA polymerase III subunit epsilon [Nocardia farcinica]MBF6264841.1 DNA polymerase III subunit epsilon [Nocardia farcinica]MBF6283627.1 DNA polymerase III subunit epsilon [Nocardia farcinica]MBF6307420.1 DNA polymerase III subunit epsilon [Nocardia farcinica]MBF6392513.1 DNA polymerase III subunit epsilon [Nocardia farcinica]
MTLTFAAFDVETANPTRGSICAVGVAIVADGVRVATHSWLCRPPAAVGQFARMNMRIHKITPQRVLGRPEFAQLLPEVLDVIGDLPVVAHNAAFDMDNVSRACGFSAVTLPDWRYGCSLGWARQQLRLESYKLDHVAAALGVALDEHHEAGADAAAAADVTIGLARLAGARNLLDLAAANGTELISLGKRRR